MCSQNKKGGMYMNIHENDIMKILYKDSNINQRNIADLSGHSLGIVNKAVNSLIQQGYLNKDNCLTHEGKSFMETHKPERAVILAAGFGMRMVPINTETPKAFLKVHGECLIERQIKQLHSAGVNEIYVVVGFLKEEFEYLIDEYGVKLIVNRDYATKGNLHSLKLVSEHLENAYIVPCDIWCDMNPFDRHELYSWYMVSDLIDDDSEVRVNRKSELVKVPKSASGNTMIGISYISREDAERVRNNINELVCKEEFEHSFWEEALYDKNRMCITAKIVKSNEVVEINTYEQLRELDSESEHLQSYAISVIQKALNVEAECIEDITVLKKGMTNRSFLFSCNDTKYIMRIPGEGTDQLINRREEADVYSVIGDKNLCDDIIYINPDNGYKITKYINGARVCDSDNQEDLIKCMKVLGNFHNMKLKVNHEFDMYNKIDFYESLWEGKASVYRDYKKTKDNVLSLRSYVEDHIEEKVLTHMDSVADNFLFSNDEDGNERINLIDWEYAAMQDPHVDLAMFCIYSMYEKEQVDNLIDIYFENKCNTETRIKIYCYIATAGLLWSNWCEYKRNLGIEFGEYSIKQYRFAKEYYRFAVSEMKEQNR